MKFLAWEESAVLGQSSPHKGTLKKLEESQQTSVNLSVILIDGSLLVNILVSGQEIMGSLTYFSKSIDSYQKIAIGLWIPLEIFLQTYKCFLNVETFY